MTALNPPAMPVPGSGQPVAQEKADQYPIWRRMVRTVFELCCLSLVWWYATIPALMVAVMWWSAPGPRLVRWGLTVPTVFAITTAVVAVGSRWAPVVRWEPFGSNRPRIVVSYRGAVAGTARQVFKMAWPWIASHAAITVSTHGFWRTPKIKAYRQDPDRFWRPSWRQVTVKPLPLQLRHTWPNIGDQLMRTIDAAEVTSTVDDYHRLSMTFTATPLPTLIPYPGPSEVENYVCLGRGVDGHEIGWRPDETPMITITGITKGGKGITARAIEIHAIRHGWIVYRANPKPTGEADWLDQHASIAHTPEGMWTQSAHVLDLMYERQRLIKRAGVDDWTEVPDIGPRVVYIIDEGANLISPVIRDERKLFAQATSSNITTLAAMARSAGIHLVYITQQPSVDSYGYAGGQVRLNIGARMIVGSSDAIWLRELFLGDIDPTVEYALAAGHKGRAVFQGLDPAHRGEVRKAQIYYATQAQAAAHLPAEPTHVPIDFDDIGPQAWAEFIDAMNEQHDSQRKRRKKHQGGQEAA
ncbi:MAG: hypothetical protein AAF467_24630 [Actinomycetota bacterium]